MPLIADIQKFKKEEDRIKKLKGTEKDVAEKNLELMKKRAGIKNPESK